MKPISARLVSQGHPGRKRRATNAWRMGVLLFLLTVLALAPAALPAEQKEKKKKDQSREPASSGAAAELPVRLPDDRSIDLAISEMFGAWQVGDVELLRKHYAEDVMVVSGDWEPPLIGWAHYLQAYRRQRERMQGGQLDRRNTYFKVLGNFAWATYQWQFHARVDGKPTAARGHTTLILEKRNDRWLIVHNHTSLVSEVGTSQPAPSPETSKPVHPGTTPPDA